MKKIFDIHTDILYDVYTAYLKNDKNRFKDYHVKQLSNSVIKGGVWTLFSPDEFNLLEALKISLDNIDFNLLKDFNVILGLESLRNLKSLEDFEKIYNLGFRHAMLTWNEENEYATGVAGNPNRGVTKKGFKVLDFMIEKDMIIDVSHLNEKSFYDVLNYTNKNVIASHSNSKNLCNHRRNLSLEQLKRLKDADALVGLTLAGAFIDKDQNNRTIDQFLNHLDEVVSIMSVNNVCFGFDFMDYFGNDVTSNIESVPNATYAHKILEAMAKRGYSDEDIRKIAHDNFYNRFSHLIYNK